LNWSGPDQCVKFFSGQFGRMLAFHRGILYRARQLDRTSDCASASVCGAARYALQREAANWPHDLESLE
jgi:hypothetical protein